MRRCKWTIGSFLVMTGVPIILSWSVFGCSPAATASVNPKAATLPSAAQRAVPADELHAALTAVERRPAPLTVLPAALTQKLEERLRSLKEPAKQNLLDVAQGAALRYPLLYLHAGGQDIAVYEFLYATPAGSDELVQLHLPSLDFASLLPLTNKLSELAANHVLRELALDFEPGAPRKVERLRDVVLAASALGRSDIELLASQELALGHPSTEHDVALARLHARRLELEPARSLLSRVSPDLESASYKKARQQVDALQLALSSPRRSHPRELAARARAYLTIGRSDLALSTLAPALDSLETNLSFATAYARSVAGGSACPLVKERIGTSALCAAGWGVVRERFDFQRLETAWNSGQGRDAISAEEYLGLVHVVPMTYGFSAEAGEDGRAVLDALERDALSLVGTASYFGGLGSMARSLNAALKSSTESAPGTRPRLSQEQKRSLFEGLRQLRSNLGEDRWGQAAELATLSLLLQDDDISEHLTSLEPRIRPEYLATFSALNLWQTVAAGDVAALSASRELLAKLIQEERETSLERTRWLMLWAEAATALQPGEKSLLVLASMANRLKSSQVPLSLRLRAAIDLAGVAVRQNDLGAAVQALDPIVQSTPRGVVANRVEQDLLILATGYLKILRALQASGKQREALAKELEDFLLSVTKHGAAPPTLQLWLALWRGELAYLVAKEGCGGSPACVRRAANIRGISAAAMADAVGASTAQLMSRGVLPVGGVEIRFQYQADGRLSPHVRLDTRFLLAPPPRSVSAVPTN